LESAAISANFWTNVRIRLKVILIRRLLSPVQSRLICSTNQHAWQAEGFAIFRLFCSPDQAGLVLISNGDIGNSNKAREPLWAMKKKIAFF
jgi:hypothetical protein